MIIAVLPLIPAAYVAGAAIVGGVFAWAKGRGKRKKELDELRKYKNNIEKQLKTIEERQKQHEDDLNGVIVNLETGQTAEQVEFGIFPKKTVSKQTNKTEEDDNYKGDNRFEILDL